MSGNELINWTTTLIALIWLFFLVAGSIVLIRGLGYYHRYPLSHPAYDKPLSERPWRGSDILLLVLFFAVVQSLIQRLLPPVDIADQNNGVSNTLLLIAGTGFQAAGLIFIFILMLRHGCGWREAFGNKTPRPKSGIRLAVLFYLGMWPVQFAVIPLYHAILRWLGVTVDWQATLIMIKKPESPGMLAVLLLMALVMAPITEELLFRGILLPVLRRRLGIWTAVIFSSLLFAFFHQHIPSTAGLFIVSVACSLVTIYSGSVLPAIWLHALFNTVSTLLALSISPHFP